jgi:nucleotide-binding universal stress UspA family protein
MTLKSILAHAAPNDRLDAVLDIVFALAKAHGAHPIGLHVSTDPAASLRTLPGPVPGELMAALEARVEAERDRAEAGFNEAARRHGISGEWRVENGDPASRIGIHARYADLTVMGQWDEEDPSSDPELPTAVATMTGRPVLIVPRAGRFQEVGKRVLVCWNASREATRAVTDALPILQLADEVTVLAVNPDDGAGHGDVPGADISHYLARHGVRAEANRTYAEAIDVADAILSRASDLGCDLIVMGAYGHSRTREWIFGGVTRSIMRTMTRPVLISH